MKFEQLQGKTVLVTGAAGFLGSHLCQTIIDNGGNVIAFDDLSQGKKENLQNAEHNKQLTFIHGDCNKDADVTAVFNNHTIDYVFHHAATTGVIRTTNDPLSVLEDIQGIKNMLHHAYTHKVKKFVFASSSEVYGEPLELPEQEDGPLNAKLPYAVVKLTGEKYCRAYWDMYKFPTTSLRFFNVFGPKQESSEYGFVVGIFMKQVIQNQHPTVFGDGSMTRNFVFVRDNINATIQSLFCDEANGHSINIGTGKPITVLELAEKIIAISGKNLKPIFKPMRAEGEIVHRYPDVTKMKELLSYEPQYELLEGLQITYDWYKTYYGSTT